VLATLLAHELGASHRLMMRLAARADGILDRAEAADDDARLGQGGDPRRVRVARMMERYRLGILALDRLRGGDKAEKQKKHYVCLYWGDDPPPGQPHINDIRPPRTDPPPPDPPPPDPPPPAAAVLDAAAAVLDAAAGAAAGHDGAARRTPPEGLWQPAPLRQSVGRPPYRAALRRRHKGPRGCRQPAMANGRCRLHGGTSTGPRTAAGLARSRAARLVHGHRSAEAIALRAAAAESGRRLGGLIDAERRLLAGHGVHRSNRTCAEPSPGDAGLRLAGRPPVPAIRVASPRGERSASPIGSGTAPGRAGAQRITRRREGARRLAFGARPRRCGKR